MFFYTKIFIDLLKEDFIFFKQTIADKTINAIFWVIPTVCIGNFILQPALNLNKSFGVFYALGTIAACGFFETIKQMVSLLKDFETSNQISYYLTLPIPNWLLWIKIGIYFSANSLFVSTMSFIACKILLWNEFSHFTINYPQLIASLIATNIFSGFFTLFLICITDAVETVRNTTMRMLYPLWIFGAFYYSWQEVNSCYSWIGTLLLLDPYVYATETTRAAVLGQSGYLPFWYCIGALLVFSLFFAAFSITRLKKRLDFI